MATEFEEELVITVLCVAISRFVLQCELLLLLLLLPDIEIMELLALSAVDSRKYSLFEFKLERAFSTSLNGNSVNAHNVLNRTLLLELFEVCLEIRERDLTMIAGSNSFSNSCANSFSMQSSNPSSPSFISWAPSAPVVPSVPLVPARRLLNPIFFRNPNPSPWCCMELLSFVIENAES